MKFTLNKLGLRVLIIMAGLFVANIMQGENIPTLKVDPAVKSGTFPNGLQWYIVTNPVVKGVADFAVVQRSGTKEVSQKLLASRFPGSATTVQGYFSKLGVVPAEGGYARVDEKAAIYTFRNVNLLQSSSVTDSTLLVLMHIVDKMSHSEDSLQREIYSPSNQAIIVSGDVNQAQILEKMKMLSYMTAKGAPALKDNYKWVETDSMTVHLDSCVNDGLAEVFANWRLERTPRQYMNTVQPVVFERFMTELAIIAQDRLRAKFISDSIPVADVMCRYKNGLETLGDEGFSVKVTVGESDIVAAISAVSEVMASLNKNGATVREIHKAGHIYMDRLKGNEMAGTSHNIDYINRCVSAFIYNAPLTTRKDIRTFLQSKIISDNVQVDIFKSIASASTDAGRNLHIRVSTRDSLMTGDSIKGVFDQVWMMSGESEDSSDDIYDVPHLREPGEKIRLKSVKKEYLSGGYVWTLSNGLRVMIKQMPTDGVIYYSMALNGGYGNISDLLPGEGACFEDMMRFTTIGGVDAGTFVEVVRDKGVSMDFHTDVSRMTISGDCHKFDLEYLFKALQTMSVDWSIDEKKLAYYLDCIPLEKKMHKHGLVDRISVIDSLMCPNYRYTRCHRVGLDAEDLKYKIESFYKRQMSKVNDGVLILVGDIDEKRLKELLVNYGGGFPTTKGRFARTVIQFQPLSGSVLMRAEGPEPCVDVVLSAPMVLTSDNYYTAELAAMVLKRHIAKETSARGMLLRVNHSFERYPHERLGLMVSLKEASVDGLASGTLQRDVLYSLMCIRDVLSDISEIEISDKLLSSYKSRLKKRVSDKKNHPQYWIDVLTDRYLDGKDLVTGADAKIDSVTKGEIAELLDLLSKGTRIEYIVND